MCLVSGEPDALMILDDWGLDPTGWTLAGGENPGYFFSELAKRFEYATLNPPRRRGDPFKVVKVDLLVDFYIRHGGNAS